MSIAIPLHLLAAVIWIGGMFFAYMFLRPTAAQLLEPPVRLSLWVAVFSGFFKWVWLAIATLFITGAWMLHLFGGMADVGMHVHIMLLVAIIMTLIFGHIFFSPFKKLKRAVADQQWSDGATALAQIRQLVLVNMSLGLILVAIAASGRYW